MCTEEFIRMMFMVDLGNRGLDSRSAHSLWGKINNKKKVNRQFEHVVLYVHDYIQRCMDLQLAVDPYKRPVLFESMD